MPAAATPANGSETFPPPRSRGALRSGLIIALLILFGLAVEWGWRWTREAIQPTGGAEWIWKNRLTYRWSGPKAFYAVRDFEIDEVPQQARVVVLGDEEYVLLLNGRRVGGNRYIAEAPLDEYRVETLLAPGTNRFTAHLRSSKGEGAFLLALYVDDEEEPRVVTGDDWRVVRRFNRKLLRQWIPVERGEQAVTIARPPEGRWGTTSRTAPRPLHDDLTLLRRGVQPLSVLLPGAGWQPTAAVFGNGTLRGGRRGRHRPAGKAVMLDWGQVVSGILTLRLAGLEAPIGLAYFGDRPPEPVRHGPDAFVIGTPGQSYWEDAVPRHFRYVLLIGVDGLVDAQLVVTDPDLLRPIPGGEAPPGVLGGPAPRLRTTAEDKIWSELESFPRGPEW